MTSSVCHMTCFMVTPHPQCSLTNLRIKYLISIINIIDERKDRDISIDELTKKGDFFINNVNNSKY